MIQMITMWEPYADPNRRDVSRSLLLPHNKAARNSTQSIARCDGSCKSCSFPLAHDVRRLVHIYCCPVANIRTSRKIGSDVADCDLRGKAKHAESCNGADAVECDDEAAKLEVVPYDGGYYDWDNGIEVWRCGQKNGLIFREPHARLEDNW